MTNTWRASYNYLNLLSILWKGKVAICWTIHLSFSVLETECSPWCTMLGTYSSTKPDPFPALGQMTNKYTLSSAKVTKAKALNGLGMKTSTTSPYCRRASAVMSSVQPPTNTFLLLKGSSGLCLEFGSLQSHRRPSIICRCDITFTWVSYSVNRTKPNPFEWPVLRSFLT